MKQAVLLALVLVTHTRCYSEQANVEGLLAQADPAIQERISGLFINLEGRKASEAELRQKVHALKNSVEDQGELVKQLAIFVALPPHTEQRLMLPYVMMHWLDLSSKVVIPVLAPYLDADDSRVRSFVRDWFQNHDNAGRGKSLLAPVNYEDYLTYARVQLNINQELPVAFIEYIFERSPERALIVFYHANPRRRAETVARLRAMREQIEADRQQREGEGPGAIPQPPANPQQLENIGPDDILVAEKIVSHAISLKKWDGGRLLPEAKDQLAQLAENDQWWVRRCVAEIMLRHRELRVPDVLEKLRDDENELVSKAAKSAQG